MFDYDLVLLALEGLDPTDERLSGSPHHPSVAVPAQASEPARAAADADASAEEVARPHPATGNGNGKGEPRC